VKEDVKKGTITLLSFYVTLNKQGQISLPVRQMTPYLYSEGNDIEQLNRTYMCLEMILRP
jgi:hypothetical protein